MTLYLLAALVVVAVVVGWLVLRRGSASHPSIRRDVPTFEQAAATRPRLGTRLGGLFGRPVDPTFWDSLEEALLAADFGVATATAIVLQIQRGEPATAQEARSTLRQVLIAEFGATDRSLVWAGRPAIVVVVGVNGYGKTTGHKACATASCLLSAFLFGQYCAVIYWPPRTTGALLVLFRIEFVHWVKSTPPAKLGNVQVNQCGVNIGMPQQILERHYIKAHLQQMGGIRVAQNMRGYMLCYPRFLCSFFDHPSNTGPCKLLQLPGVTFPVKQPNIGMFCLKVYS